MILIIKKWFSNILGTLLNINLKKSWILSIINTFYKIQNWLIFKDSLVVCEAIIGTKISGVWNFDSAITQLCTWYFVLFQDINDFV